MTRSIETQSHRLSGFTLLELVIYSAMVSLIVGAFLSAAFFLINTSGRDRERSDMVEQERFLTMKLHWLLYDTTSSSVWVNGGVIYLRKPDLTQYAVRVSNGVLEIAPAVDTNGDGIPDSSNSPVRISNNHVTVTSPQFSLVSTNSQTALNIQFTLQGKNETRTFVQTEYLP